MKKIPLKLGPASYDVLIANGLLRAAGNLLVRRSELAPSLCIVVTSPRIRKLWGRILEKSLRAAKLKVTVLEIPDGERNKDLRTVESLMRQMVVAGTDRDSIVVAFGGGLVGDVAGFAASIYMRGIPVVQIPTTLLAQVDASIGGKTGVNLPTGKNLVGTFHQPTLVLIDPELLSTLPDREYRSGMFEVIKCGVIRDAKLLRSVEHNQRKIKSRDPGILLDVIAASVKVKAKIVSLDEREGGLRRILNFGHTIGHALEADSGYKLFLHGEAVGWGMIAAARIGVEAGVTPPAVAQRIQDAILQFGPLPEVSSSANRILRLIRSDKKTLRGVPNFVLARSIGKTTISSQIAPSTIKKVIEDLRKINAALVNTA